MNKDKVRALLNKFFKGRDLDQDIEKLYPLFDKKRLVAILDGSQDFNKADVIVMLSVGVELGDGPTMSVPGDLVSIMQDIRKETGDLRNVVGH
jgi:hypothetical protein